MGAGASVAPPDLLETIVAATRRAVQTRCDRVPMAVLERRAADREPQGEGFRRALSRRGRVNVIAECKRRSPSRGVLRAAYNPALVARGYVEAGAVALSVLTEPMFFDGALEHLATVRAMVSVPLLRKDFIVTEYQLLEARAEGADAVLLIVAALEDDDLRRLLKKTDMLDLAALVEVHDETEQARAVQGGAAIIGVNSRDLRTLEVKLDALTRLIGKMPADVVAVAESGLRTGEEMAALRRAGYDAFLIGESLMTRPDPGAALRDLLDTASRGVESCVSRSES
jgi:indole-3-glycerol phosphate synthase